MNDKTKPDKSQAGVASTLQNCGYSSDASSMSITSGIIADNLAEGKKGKPAIIGSARVSDSVGQCVADAYDEKKPGIGDRLSSWVGGLKSRFDAATTDQGENLRAAIPATAPKPAASSADSCATLKAQVEGEQKGVLKKGQERAAIACGLNGT